jgi:hypothetical protein
MLISRHIYDSLQSELMKAQAEANAVRGMNTQLNVHLEWIRARLTQVEIERAQLIKKYLGVDVPVATFEPTQDVPDLNQTTDFRDIGDKEAAALGIDWNPDGTLRYKDR